MGQNTTITVIDTYNSDYSWGRVLKTPWSYLPHGEWVTRFAYGVAPQATTNKESINSRKIELREGGLNIVNMSYNTSLTADQIFSIINGRDVPEAPLVVDVHKKARAGEAVFVKSAGNDSQGMLDVVKIKNIDGVPTEMYRGVDLVLLGTPTIYVGTLNRNGQKRTCGKLFGWICTKDRRARLASYSNYPGDSKAFQKQFLAVGVIDGNTGHP